MVLKADNKEFIRFALSLIIGMSVSMFICMIYPNGLTLRPDNIPDNIFGKLVTVLYATDTTTNVFPSIHVYNSIAVHTALSKCKALKDHKYIVNASLILCILICLSTIFLKQHSVYDVIGGIVLMAFMYFMLYILPERNAEAKCEAESQQSITD
jgi:membrane-associated phospholipid phosphatase